MAGTQYIRNYFCHVHKHKKMLMWLLFDLYRLCILAAARPLACHTSRKLSTNFPFEMVALAVFPCTYHLYSCATMTIDQNDKRTDQQIRFAITFIFFLVYLSAYVRIKNNNRIRTTNSNLLVYYLNLLFVIYFFCV